LIVLQDQPFERLRGTEKVRFKTLFNESSARVAPERGAIEISFLFAISCPKGLGRRTALSAVRLLRSRLSAILTDHFLRFQNLVGGGNCSV
jgi:hypothetical protein